MKLEPISKLNETDCNTIKATNGESYFEVSLPTRDPNYDSFKLSFTDLTSYIDTLIKNYISDLSSTVAGKYLPLSGGTINGNLQVVNQFHVQGQSLFDNMLTCMTNVVIDRSGLNVGSNIKLNPSGTLTASNIESTNLKVSNTALLTALHALWS